MNLAEAVGHRLPSTACAVSAMLSMKQRGTCKADLKVSPAYRVGMPGAESGPVISTTQCSRGSNLISAQPSGGCSSQSWSSLCSRRCQCVPKEPVLRAPAQQGVKAGQGAPLRLSSIQSVSQHALQQGLDCSRGLELLRMHRSSRLALHVSRYHLKHFKDNGVTQLSLAAMLLVMRSQVQQPDVELALQQEESLCALNMRWPHCCSRALEAD